MKFFLFLILLISSISFDSTAKTTSNSNIEAVSLFGKWQFYQYEYRGQVFESPNPYLNQYLLFNLDEVTLFYEKTNENFFCERSAFYQYSQIDQELIQSISWVNPRNSSGCSQDPDMQMGNHLRNKAYIKNKDLYLHTPFGDEELIFIWKKRVIFITIKSLSKF